MNSDKVCLIVLDGWGHGPKDDKVNAVMAAKTPFVDSLYKDYPNSELMTCGEFVGLPDGQMGNSEVGHLNIGAGRVVYQQLVLINKAFDEGTVNDNPVLNNSLAYAQENNKSIHLIGLVSDGGIHSHINHLKGLLKFYAEKGFEKVYVHAFTDGRDTDPQSGAGFIAELEDFMTKNVGQVASIVGRYYAMDRDFKWDRIKLAYDAMLNGEGEQSNNLIESIKASYQNDVTDEFIKPIINSVCGSAGQIAEGDVVININFRTDRGRQITRALTQESFDDVGMKPIDIKYLTLTEYDATYKGVDVLFPSIDLKNTLGEVMASNGKTQLRIAETEKYPHVTFFFSGGVETPFEGEERLMAQSPKVATYDFAPEMSAHEIADKANAFIDSNQPNFIMLNFANADMVGHTGVFSAVIKAVETADAACKRVVEHGLANGYTFLVTADHGNADYEVNDDGSPNTAHTTNPVPFFLISPDKHYKKVKDGKLADLAPTVLEIMGVEQPVEMTGVSLIEA
ncbi:MAG: 2,3-bisphosphoglycerate-independent phosphoglycerate mutase [Bacteroidia bacterium]